MCYINKYKNNYYHYIDLDAAACDTDKILNLLTSIGRTNLSGKVGEGGFDGWWGREGRAG